MAFTCVSAESGKIEKGRGGTPLLDFERLVPGQHVMVYVDFDAKGKDVEFTIDSPTDDARPLTPISGKFDGEVHVHKAVVFEVVASDTSDAGTVEVEFELMFTDGDGKWANFSLCGEISSPH